MVTLADTARLHLSRGPLRAPQLMAALGVAQATVSRTLKLLGDDVVRLGAGRSTHYLLRDRSRGLADMPVYRVDAQGQIRQLGTLVPVRPEGFVMQQADGVQLHSEGLPWWLFDMRPQGFLGRAYAQRHASGLGLPDQLKHWSDTDALRALLAHGHDAVGNLLLGERARERFVNAELAAPLPEQRKPTDYAQRAQEADRGELPGSSAGGEQPKFTAWVETPAGPRHVLVKFTQTDDNPVTERWRDLLLAEHLALETLRAASLPAVRTRVIDRPGQRFLEIERFDRVGPLGRRGLFSLTALDAEFVGAATEGWATLTQRLAQGGQVLPAAAETAALLQAFGTLIGNTDMHLGNLSFMSEHGRPYQLAPCYDMLPMGFAPQSGGALTDHLPPVNIQASIGNATWQRALALALAYRERVHSETRFSARFAPCLQALEQRWQEASTRIARLG